MPTTPIILVLGLLVATCVIAYWADNLGKKLGKKRISLFGLRPRQTATLISMVSSVGIMLFTLIVLLVFSDSVRNALLYYDTVRANLNRVEARNLSLQNQNKATLRDMQALEDERAKLSRQVTEADTELERAGKQVEQTRGRIAKAQSQLENIRQRLAATEKSRDAARSSESRARASASRARQAEAQARGAEREALERYKIADNRYLTTQNRYLQAQNQLTEADRQLTQANLRLEQVNRELEVNNKELETAQNELRVVQRELGTTARNLNTTAKKFTETRIELEARQIEVFRLQQEQEGLQKAIGEAQLFLNYAQQQIRFAERIMTERIVIEAGTVFAASTLPSRLSAAQARVALMTLAKDAHAAVEKMRPSRGLEISDSLDGRDGTRIFLSEPELIEQLTNYLAQMPTPVSVRVVAKRDHIQADEVIFSHFLAVPVRVIYPRGSTLASATIDGNQGDALIFRGLLRLTDIGAAEARRRGAVPLVTREDEPFFAEGTNERIFITLRRISELNKPVLVRLVADEDLTTVAPLRVRFDLADAPDDIDEDSNGDAESS